ncbi:MAG: TIGR01841 family phasin [Pseudomonadota bacterium]|nr:TIGR01841 family phasin [Pseudomonadota bacterium]
MSKPASNPFFEADFSKFMDVSKMMGEFKMPFFDAEALSNAYRRNMETVALVNQATLETVQTLARRQAELVRQGFEETTGIVNAIMSGSTPEEKMLRQAEASKAAVEKCIANARDFAETVNKCHTKTMETVSNRMAEGLEELRGIIKNGKVAA